jgi:hypothetical protein
MATNLCTKCGHVLGRGDVEPVDDDTRCPQCGTAGYIAWSPSDLSADDVRGFMSPGLQIDMRPGESQQDAIDREFLDYQRKQAGGELVRMFAIILFAGALAGGAVYYFMRDWPQAVVIGLAVGFSAVWLVDLVTKRR